MPPKNEIHKEILNGNGNKQDIIRRRYLKQLHTYTKRDVIIYSSAYSTLKSYSLDSYFLSIEKSDVQGFMSALHGLKGNELDLIIHSPGGSVEVVEQIVNYLRQKYSHIRAIIPQDAMSAATMLACACDVIIMGKHSTLGPIDPQVTFPTPTGYFTAPAHSIITEFNLAQDHIIQNINSAPLWINKISNLPAGILDICNKSIKLSRKNVKTWLNDNMFKNDSQGLSKAESISKWLIDTNEHLTHGRPISANLAAEKGLKIHKLEDDQKLQELVLSIFHATMITFDLTNCAKIIENHNGKGYFPASK